MLTLNFSGAKGPGAVKERILALFLAVFAEFEVVEKSYKHSTSNYEHLLYTTKQTFVRTNNKCKGGASSALHHEVANLRL